MWHLLVVTVLLWHSPSQAAESYGVASAQLVRIDEHGVCKNVTNNHAQSIFVPTKTAVEWSTFRSNATQVTIADCPACAPGKQIFGVGDNQTFVVPASCTSITVKAWGAGGGAGDCDMSGYDGGGGGYAATTLAVTAGESLKVRVGYPAGGIASSSYGWGGNGGGSSSVLRGTTILIEAGGGGGATSCYEDGAPGGATLTCANPGNQPGVNAAPGECGGGGAGYCAGPLVGCAGSGGSSYVPGGGTLIAGAGTAPGNSGDADRGNAGNGSAFTYPIGETGAGPGRVVISW